MHRGHIPGVCPYCRAKIDIAAASEDAAVNRALGAMAGFAPPALRRVLIPYLSLFSPPGRSIAPAKLARIADALAALIQADTFSRNRESFAATMDDWVAGIDIVLAAEGLELPLDARCRQDPHAYLKAVVAGQIGDRTRKDAAAAKPLHPSHYAATRPDSQRSAGAQQAGALLDALKPHRGPPE